MIAAHTGKLSMVTLRGLVWWWTFALAAVAPGWSVAQVPDARAATEAAAVDATGTQQTAYFGDLHIHTMYSFDAFLASERNSPDDAYRYAKGEPIRHRAGGTVQLSGPPLDFLAITDHAEWLGVHAALELSECNDRVSSECRAAMGAAWRRGIAAAERHNDPGTFTALIGYEYGASHPVAIHRNVVFRSATVPALPFSAWDSDNPRDLWDWLDRHRALGMDAVVIPHNPNDSGGWEFRPRTWEDAPLDAAYARQRMRNEPLVEVTQNKGTAEVHPLLAPNDEWAGFQIKDGQVRHSTLRGKYWRAALKTGLEVEGELDVNPFRLGVVGASDSHVTGGSYDEDAYFTNRSTVAEQRAEVFTRTEDGWASSPIDSRGKALSGTGGLTGIWAEQNTRASLFDALKRRETFATSGPRIKVRFFAGYGLAERLTESEDEVAASYANGVPMGGVLGARSDVAPSFLVWAVRDPQAGRPQRLQIVKGWLEDGSARERVIDVACSDGLVPDAETGRCPDNGAAVDVADCSVSADVGANELRTVWTDPDFDVTQPAFYYVRVLENPSCRWSTWDAVRLGTEPHPDLPATHQERAWGSPIWFDASRIELVLGALRLSDVDIGAFVGNTTAYAGSAAYGLESTTVTARAAHSGATVTIMPPDADAEMEGHQVALSEGENTIEVAVTAADGVTAVDGTATRTYTVRVTRASPPDYDGLVAAGNGAPRGLWGDGETLWVADYLDSKLYAYAMADGRHMTERDVETLAGAGNSRPTGVWSDGETLWVADYWDAKLYGYRLADGRRAAARDVALAAGNRKPTGLWGDGETLWVLDKEGARVYAYRMVDGSRNAVREFALASWEADEFAWGLWSDGDVFLVAGYTAGRVFAYRDGSRVAGRDIASLRNRRPTGLWSDGRTLWASEYQGGNPKLYAHPLPVVSTNATLTRLGLSGVDLGPFSPATTAYRGETAAAQATVSAFPADGASLAIEPADADTAAQGHQVDLSRSETPVTVTAADGTTKRTYTVTAARTGTLPVVTLAADGPATEGSAAEFTAFLDTAPWRALEVAVGVTAEGDVLSDPVPSSVTFAAGARSAARSGRRWARRRRRARSRTRRRA